MKPFVFRLQTALDMKIHLEEQAKINLEKANRAYNNSMQQLRSLEDHLLWTQDELRRIQSGELKVDELKTVQDFIPVLSHRIDNQKIEVQQRKKQVNELRAALIGIMKDRKVLEKIKSRNYQEYLRQALLEEQKQIDEMALNRYKRKDNPS